MQANTTRTLRWPVLNLLAFIGTVVVNGLANTLPLNGIQTGT